VRTEEPLRGEGRLVDGVKVPVFLVSKYFRILRRRLHNCHEQLMRHTQCANFGR
jgi:hypothetical protein